MDRGTWWATVHRVSKNRTWMKQLTHTHAYTIITTTVSKNYQSFIYCILIINENTFEKQLWACSQMLYFFFNLSSTSLWGDYKSVLDRNSLSILHTCVIWLNSNSFINNLWHIFSHFQVRILSFIKSRWLSQKHKALETDGLWLHTCQFSHQFRLSLPRWTWIHMGLFSRIH